MLTQGSIARLTWIAHRISPVVFFRREDGAAQVQLHCSSHDDSERVCAYTFHSESNAPGGAPLPPGSGARLHLRRCIDLKEFS